MQNTVPLSATSSPEIVQLGDESNDHKYYIVVPQIVWALSRTPHDFTLWSVIKMVAGDNRECFLTTDDLATLAMMSAGKVSDCRKYLISVGLLLGEIRKDPGYPQPVWHLKIPDIWEENIQWRKKIDSLKKRINLKRYMLEAFKESDQLRTFKDSSVLPNMHVTSLHNMKPSQYEEGPSQNEGGPSQNETKKNPCNNTKRKTELIDPLTHIVQCAKRGVSEKTGPVPADQWIVYGKQFEQIYQQLTGQTLAQAERDELSKVYGQDDADPEIWRQSVTVSILNWSGQAKIPPLARMIEIYLYGQGDYQKFAIWKWGGKEDQSSAKPYTPPGFRQEAYEKLQKENGR